MSHLKQIAGIVCALAFTQGCAREKSFNVEQLATGGYLVHAQASVMGEPPDTATRRAAEDAEKFCKLEGRRANIKTLTQSGRNFLNTTNFAEAEFDCATVGARDRRS